MKFVIEPQVLDQKGDPARVTNLLAGWLQRRLQTETVEITVTQGGREDTKVSLTGWTVRVEPEGA